MTEAVSLRQRLAVFSVALGTFTLVTNEFLPVALLTPIRTSLGVSQGHYAVPRQGRSRRAARGQRAAAGVRHRGPRGQFRGGPAAEPPPEGDGGGHGGDARR